MGLLGKVQAVLRGGTTRRGKPVRRRSSRQELLEHIRRGLKTGR